MIPPDARGTRERFRSPPCDDKTALGPLWCSTSPFAETGVRWQRPSSCSGHVSEVDTHLSQMFTVSYTCQSGSLRPAPRALSFAERVVPTCAWKPSLIGLDWKCYPLRTPPQDAGGGRLSLYYGQSRSRSRTTILPSHHRGASAPERLRSSARVRGHRVWGGEGCGGGTAVPPRGWKSRRGDGGFVFRKNRDGLSMLVVYRLQTFWQGSRTAHGNN